MIDSHPDWAILEAVRTGEAAPEEAAHVVSCADCRRAMDDLQELASRLRSARRPTAEVPADRRNAIRAEATRTIRRSRRRWWIPAAAAALLAGLGLWFLNPSPPIPGDVDRSGRVDIVDAYRLAVSIQSGESLDPVFDVTGDGRVDAEDVDEIARVSVALGDGGGQ